MITKNTEFEKVKNVTVVLFGRGSVEIAAFTKVGEYTGLSLKSCNPMPIGSERDTEGLKVEENGIDVAMVFEKVESIEVLEKYLREAKEDLLNMKLA